MPLFSLDRSPTLINRPYSPQRAMRLAGLAGAGSMLAAVGIIVSGGGTSAGPTSATAQPVAADPGTAFAASVATTPAAATPSSTVPSTTSTLAAPVCTNTYTVLAGDFWLRIASEASIPVEALYALNNATAATGLFPGQVVCLPDGTTVVVTTSPPSTIALPLATAPKATVPKAAPAPAPVATTPSASSHSSG